MAMTARYTVINGEVISEKRGANHRTYVPDANGNTVALVDDGGTVTDTFTYWPYGEVKSRTGSTPTPFQFGGTLGYYKDSQQSYVRRRYLSHPQGRWTSVDFMWPSERGYEYAGSNPSSASDPTGLSPCSNVARTLFGTRKPNESRASHFRRCQSFMELQYSAQQKHPSWAQRGPDCPGGFLEICEACKSVSGLRHDCQSQTCPPGSKQSSGSGFVMGLITHPFGKGGDLDRDACVAACMGVAGTMNTYSGEGWATNTTRRFCIHFCDLLSRSPNGCERLFEYCLKQKGYLESRLCAAFYTAHCKGD